MAKKYLLILLIIVVLPVLALFMFKNQVKVKVSQNEKELKEVKKEADLSPKPLKKLDPPKLMIDKNKKYTAVLTISQGEIQIKLFVKKTPLTVNNFIYLASLGFYNNTVFHRVIDGFMIQGGDPRGDGTGGPGYRFDDEPFTGEYQRGVVAMANSGPNTNGSQFFIMHQNYPLPKKYVIFGQVIKGLAVVDKIAQSPVKLNASGEKSKPVNPVVVKTVKIIEN